MPPIPAYPPEPSEPSEPSEDRRPARRRGHLGVLALALLVVALAGIVLAWPDAPSALGWTAIGIIGLVLGGGTLVVAVRSWRSGVGAWRTIGRVLIAPFRILFDLF